MIPLYHPNNSNKKSLPSRRSKWAGKIQKIRTQRVSNFFKKHLSSPLQPIAFEKYKNKIIKIFFCYVRQVDLNFRSMQELKILLKNRDYPIIVLSENTIH